MKLLSLSVCCVLFLISAGSLHAQQLEAGLLINSNIPKWKTDNDRYYESIEKLPGFGFSLRYLQPYGFPLFRNMAATIDWRRTEIEAVERRSPGGIGGDAVRYSFKSLQFCMTDYFFNRNLFKKSMQLPGIVCFVQAMVQGIWLPFRTGVDLSLHNVIECCFELIGTSRVLD